MIKEPVYLGDAVYLSPWEQVPGGVILTTNSHRILDAGEVILLEPETLEKLKSILCPPVNT